MKCQDDRCSGAYSLNPFHVLRAIRIPALFGFKHTLKIENSEGNTRQVRHVNKHLISDTLWQFLHTLWQFLHWASVPGPRTWFSARFGRRSGLLPKGGEPKNFKQTVDGRCFCQGKKVDASSKVSKLRSLNTDDPYQRSNVQRWATSCDVQKVPEVLSSTK